MSNKESDSAETCEAHRSRIQTTLRTSMLCMPHRARDCSRLLRLKKYNLRWSSTSYTVHASEASRTWHKAQPTSEVLVKLGIIHAARFVQAGPVKYVNILIGSTLLAQQKLLAIGMIDREPVDDKFQRSPACGDACDVAGFEAIAELPGDLAVQTRFHIDADTVSTASRAKRRWTVDAKTVNLVTLFGGETL